MASLPTYNMEKSTLSALPPPPPVAIADAGTVFLANSLRLPGGIVVVFTLKFLEKTLSLSRGGSQGGKAFVEY
ncbi:uncharacterized protein TrAtP1_005468 [Trichoderma atroviride]|uniref:uncharacterized protein n=1 Tax=Hypocrea atroviridis TaxID=63577 RepID=UPI0033168BD1|nr:hypothetical protein TrAtP1_005468 [Trichoderma atroviride]